MKNYSKFFSRWPLVSTVLFTVFAWFVYMILGWTRILWGHSVPAQVPDTITAAQAMKVMDVWFNALYDGSHAMFRLIVSVLIGFTILFVWLVDQNRKMRRWGVDLEKKVEQLQRDDRDRTKPALRNIVRMIETMKPADAPQEFVGRLDQLKAIVGQIRRLDQPQVVVRSVDGEQVEDGDREIDVLVTLEQLRRSLEATDQKVEGAAAAIGDIQKVPMVAKGLKQLEVERQQAKADAVSAPAPDAAAGKPATQQAASAPPKKVSLAKKA